MIDNWLTQLRDSLLPGHCLLCLATPIASAICDRCQDSLPWIGNPCRGCALPLPGAEPSLCADCLQSTPVFDLAWAAFRLAPPVQGLIHRLKYSAGFGGANALGTMMALRLARRPQPLPDLLIPVPLHHLRQRLRGYNQAHELAQVISKVLSIPVAPRAVARTKRTQDQIGQSAVERRRNLRGAFAARESMQGLHIALLDDVMTTGTTLSELARACRKAGAVRVEAWAVARALLHD
jgi:ComF family protein